MRKFLKIGLWAFLPVLLLVACSDDENPEPPVDEPMEEVIKGLESISGVKDFTDALKQYSSSLNIQEEKLTVLAAKSFGNSTRASDNNETLKRHIVKGVYDFGTMTSDTVMVTTIAGEQLYVIKADNKTILVNGIPLVSIEQTKAGESVIYVIAESLPSTVEYVKPKYSITFTVFECNEEWSPENNQPAFPSSGAMITIYREVNDNPTKPIYYQPVDSIKTDAEGKVVYQHNYADGVYYTAANGDKEHLYSGFLPVGVYTSQAEVDNGSDYQTGISAVDEKKPGTLILADLNGDGIINGSDEFLSEYIGAEANEEVTLYLVTPRGPYDSVTEDNIWNTPEDMLNYMSGLDKTFLSFVHLNYIIDYRLTLPDVSYPKLTDLYEAKQLWEIGYKLNASIVRTNELLETNQFSKEVRNLWKGDYYNAALAYVYATMVKYWGDVALVLKIDPSDMSSLYVPRNPKAEVMTYFESMIPGLATGEANIIKALMARYFANEKEYQKAARYAGEIIDSNSYELVSDSLSSASNKEAILGGFPAGENTKVFSKGKYIYPLRYSEIILTLAEVSIELGDHAKAIQCMNMINQKNGNANVSVGMTTEQMRTTVQELWKQEFNKEGISYMLINRWGKLQTSLGQYGAESHNQLLPIAPEEIMKNPNMSQNPGY